MWNGNFYVIVKQRQANAHIYTHYDCSWATVSWGGCLLHALLHCCKQCDSSRESFGSDQCPGRSHVQQSTACVHPTSITITAACYTSNINTTITISPKINNVLLITITTAPSIWSDLIFSRPRSEGWPHHGCTFSIYPCPLSFWLTLPRRVLSTSWCCPSRPCMAFLTYIHLALLLALSLSPGNSLVSSWCDHSMLLPCFDSV